jgi:hypothetical protein
LADSLIPAARSQREDGLKALEMDLDNLEELRKLKINEAEQHTRELEQQARAVKAKFMETQVKAKTINCWQFR